MEACINVNVGTVVFPELAVHFFFTVTIHDHEIMSNHTLISSYAKDIYHKHELLPEFVNIWDMNKPMKYYSNMRPNSELIFKQLCRKIATLFMFLGARRKKAVLAVDIVNVIVQTNKAILIPNKTLKHTNPKHPLET